MVSGRPHALSYLLCARLPLTSRLRIDPIRRVSRLTLLHRSFAKRHTLPNVPLQTPRFRICNQPSRALGPIRD